MSLVAYGSSDESGDENDKDSALEVKDSFETNDDDQSKTNNVINNDTVLEENGFLEEEVNSPNQKNKQERSSSLFSSLPAPKSKALKFEVENKLSESPEDDIPRKQPVKITVPSLSQFKDEEDEEPVTKKLKPSSKGSGLFSILPAPKNMTVKEVNRPLVPHSVKRNTAPTPKIAPEAPKKLSTDLFNYADSEEESGDEETSSSKDFFALTEETTSLHSLTTDVKCTVDNSITSEPQESSKQSEILEFSHPYSSTQQSEQPLPYQPGYQQNFWLQYGTVPPPPPPPPPPPETPPPETEIHETTDKADHIPVDNGELQLDDEALQRLCGRRAKRQGQAMELIDVSGDALMPDPKEWLTKQLTQEQQTKVYGHSHRRNDGPTTQQRRKHQITYLAFQAKENELELKNQWSQNRMSKKQTQSKYGF